MKKSAVLLTVAAIIAGVVFTAAGANTARTGIDITGWSPGTYIVTIAADGTPTWESFRLYGAGSAPVPSPEPPINPTDPVATHRNKIRSLTTAVTDSNKANTKLALSKLYSTVAGLPLESREQFVQTTDALFNALNLTAWKEWKAGVDASLTGFKTLDEAKRAWVVVAEVLGEK